ncbi:hypothetical protein [Burkholderia gladioli]|uniref:hypothetical protein n=1 Tax=Burkholderia gladioli TaxID=28095 RepID=UPI00163E9844|nr:hypothetical protein [Burkholderia gladioli]MBU9426377.1 hypothetical protein [Burkholderia gladioli]MDN8063455.1 hypothetical protein [Burkholderia gladioli]
MNTTRLRQGGLVVAWTVETVCVGVAAPWILIPYVLALVMLTSDAVTAKHMTDQLITFDGVRWHLVGITFWTRLTWLCVVLIFAYRLTQTRSAQDAANRAAIRVGGLVRRWAPRSFARLELHPGTLGRMVFVLLANFTIQLAFGLFLLSVQHGAAHRHVSAPTTPIPAAPRTVSSPPAETAAFAHDTISTSKGDAA